MRNTDTVLKEDKILTNCEIGASNFEDIYCLEIFLFKVLVAILFFIGTAES